jgi:hypothetical protein
MTTLQKIEKKGYKVTFFMSGKGVQATKGNLKIVAPNVTKLLKAIN